MENSIFDYLAYYKNSSFDEVKFNMIDALLYSIIAYVPITELRDNSSLKTLNSITTNMKSSGTMATLAINVIRVMADSIRYKDVRLYRLVKEYNDRLLFLLKLKSVVFLTCLTVIIDKFVTVNSDAELCLAV